MWEVEYTDDFGAWWDTLSEAEHEAVTFSVNLLRQDKIYDQYLKETGAKK
jgi:hypothetical protein